jgi:tetratricopeptide (TPR) repeat protein
MSGRRVLIIGSQCKRLGRLSFLPEVAVRFHALMTDPGPGECLGAEVGDPTGLLLDPTVNEAKSAIKAAYDAAARGGETLILAYIGHGEFVHGDFFLMPTDAANPPNPDDAIHLAAIIKHRPAHPDGLIVLLDACYSGSATWNAVEYWVRWLEGQLRFEVLTATNDMPTANAWFTRSLVRLLERGDPAGPEQLRCEGARQWVMKAHPQLIPQLSAHNAGGHLRLGRNSSKVPGDVFWKDSPGRVQILERTEYFQPTVELAELVAASQAQRSVIVVGEAGVGKSALAAALARPEITDGRVPPGFAHAVAMLGSTTNLRNLAVDLERQLRHSVAGFAGAVDEFHRSVVQAERDKLDFLGLMVLGPLDYLDGRLVVRVALDGLDQLSDGMRRQLRGALGAGPDRLRLVMTARDDTPDCPDGTVVRARRTDGQVLGRYLEERGIAESIRAVILGRAQDHWLIAHLLADAVVEQPGMDLSRLPGTVNEAYGLRLDQAGAADDWPGRFRPVLGPLAVAGTGPILPIDLLVHASAALGGSSEQPGMLGVLDALRGLVVRRDPGTPDEHSGLFHATLAEYLLSPEAASAGFAIDALGAHRALVGAIEALAPALGHKPHDPLHRYAFLREAGHRWALGEFDQALECLERRDSNSPRENLDRWRPWEDRFASRLGRDHPSTLTARGHIGRWTGETGDAREALRLLRDLLPDCERVLGCDHPDTLAIRHNIADWTGETGDAREALRLLVGLLPDQERVLGSKHRHTLANLSGIAHWIGETGDARESMRLFRELLPDQERVLGRDHPQTLGNRSHIAQLAGEVGDTREALRLFGELLPDQERVLGRDHPDIFRTRNNIASFSGRQGDAREALRLYRELLPDTERALGRDHPDTLNNRDNIAYWTGETGDGREALRLYQELLPDWERVRGRDHPDTLRNRHNIAGWTGKMGGAREALRLLQGLLPDRERVLGRDHPQTLSNRNNIAHWTGETGDVREALRLYRGLLPDRERVLGRDHPGTLTARSNIAQLTGKTGNVREALRLCEELLLDEERVLGRDHPSTLTSRNNIAHWTGETGNVREALRLHEELLLDKERVLGRDHPSTLNTRSFIAKLTGRTGNAREAVRLLVKLLPDRERVLGRDHPDTLNTRDSIVYWISRMGDARETLGLFLELLPDQERVLGSDHPSILTTRHNIAIWTAETGDVPGALRLFVALLPDQERVLGRDHADTLKTRNNIASFTGRAGDAREALRLSRELLPDRERVLGRDHPSTLITRYNIATWAGEMGDVREAYQLFVELLPDQERVLGRDHPDTLRTRNEIEHLVGEKGDVQKALRLYGELLPERERELGLGHPGTLTTLLWLGILTIRNDDSVGGCRHLREAWARAEARLGADHPETRRCLAAIQKFGCGAPGPDGPVSPGPR